MARMIVAVAMHHRGRDLFFVRPVRSAPDYHHEDSDQWDISIAIGHGLIADLHQPNDRHQRSEIPKPSCYKIWAVRALSPHQNTHPDKDEPGHCNLPAREGVAGMGIIHCQSRGPQCFPQVHAA